MFATYLYIHCFSGAPTLITLNDLEIWKASFVIVDALYSYAVRLPSLASLSSVFHPPVCMYVVYFVS